MAGEILSNEEINELLRSRRGPGSTASRKEYPDISLIDELWIAWSAGFIDGEGSISISRQKSPRMKTGHQFTIRLTGTNVVVAPLDRLMLMYGGSVYKGRNRSAANWTIWSKGACDALRAMRPYFMVKGAHADLAIEFQEKCLGVQSSYDEKMDYFSRMRSMQTRARHENEQ